MRIISTSLKIIVLLLSIILIQTNQSFAQEKGLILRINGFNPCPNDTICIGHVLALTGSATGGPTPITYPNPRWSGSGIIYLSTLISPVTFFTATVPGSFTVTYTAYDGNMIAYFVTKTIIVDITSPLNIVTPPGGIASVYCNTPFNLTVSGAASYYWYENDCTGGPYGTNYFATGSSVIVTPTSPGPCKYRVDGYGPLGCPSDPPYQEFTISILNPANAGPDQTIAVGSNAHINGSVGGGATSGIWSTSGSGVFLPNNSTLNVTYVPSTGDNALGAVSLTLTTDDPPVSCTSGSDPMVLTIRSEIANNIIAADQTICSGNIPAPISGSVPTGGSGTYTYQWQKSTSGSGGTYTDISGATGQNYNPGALVVSTWYRRVVSSPPAANSVSNVIAITVNPVIANNTIAADQTIYNGTTPVPLTGSIPTGGNGTFNYQWQSSAVGATGPFADIAGATGQNYSPGSLVVTTWYKRVVNSLPCANSLSNVIQITVRPPIGNNTIAADQTIISGSVPSPLTGTLPTGGTESFTYQWQSSTAGSGGPFNDISGATSQNYAPAALVTTTWYKRIVFSPPCANSGSNIVQITVNTPVGNNIIAANQSLCAGFVPDQLLGSLPTGGSGVYNYQWQKSTVGASGPFTDISGATGQDYQPAILPVSTWFRRMVNSPPCCNSASNVIVVMIAPNIYAHAGPDVTICNGINCGSTTLGAVPPATGGSPPYTFLWSTVPPSTWSSNLPNPVVNPTVTTTYILAATDQNPCVGYDTIVVTTRNYTVHANAGPDLSLCANCCTANLGGIAPFTTGWGGVAPYTYLWSSTPAYPWTPGQNNVANPIVHPAVTTTFSVSVTDANGCCANDNVIIAVFPELFADAGNDTSFCSSIGGRIGGNPTAFGGTPPFSYVWTSIPGGINSTDPNPMVYPVVTTTYMVRVEDGHGCMDNDSVIVFLSNNLSINAGRDTLLCMGTINYPLGGNPTASCGQAPYTYLWSSVPAYSWTAGQNTLANPLISPTVTSTFTVRVTDQNSVIRTDNVILTVKPMPTVNAGPDQTVEDEEDIHLSGSIGGSATSATWSGGNGTFSPNNTTLNATYHPDINETFITLTLTTNIPSPCSAASDQMNITVEPVAITEWGNNIKLKLFPNPTEGIVYLKMEGHQGEIKIKVQNCQGSIVYSENVYVNSNSYSNTIDLSKFAYGVYFIQIITDNKTMIHKIIKQ